MIKRFALRSILTDANGTRYPDVPANISWVCVHDFPAINRMLVKANLPDGTPTTNDTIADVLFDEDGNQTEIQAAALTTTQRNAIRNWLTNQGVDVTQIDTTVTDRRKLLLALLNKIAKRADIDLRMLINGYDCN